MLLSSGCGVLIGNVKPVDEKSEEYYVTDLSKSNNDWVKLDPASTSEKQRENNESTEISDVTFQSKSTASIISLNSACRPNLQKQKHDLREFTRELLFGISDITRRTEKETSVSGETALETTVRGKLNTEPMMLRTVILQHRKCVYDLMYIARPNFFKKHLDDFSRFVASLKLK
ncbi:MAG: hypothetical protein A3K03_09570 [Bdellovibrionales bacterium RIFOXYD1_FULL_44_7]|nr:MAG: hypothetical protein A3K03_09570 [Bdellovibrionales bacterium RIFOXYD1_FULL_44_7]